jgi:hypothetical protein
MGNITESLVNDQSIVHTNATADTSGDTTQPTAEDQKAMGIYIAVILAAGIGSLAFMYYSSNLNRRR